MSVSRNVTVAPVSSKAAPARDIVSHVLVGRAVDGMAVVGAGVGLDSGDVSAAPGAVLSGGYPSSAAKPGGQDMFRPDLFATPSVGDIATKPPAAEAAKPGLSATGGSEDRKSVV